MLTSMDVKFPSSFACCFGKFRRYRDVQFCRYSLNGRCRRSSCILTVLATYLVSSSAISSSQNVWNVPWMFRYFVFSTKTTQTSAKGFSVAVHFPGIYAVLLRLFSAYRKRLPNFNFMVNGCLRRISRGIWANQKRRRIFWMDNGLYFTSHATDSHEL